jgi:hypothetical protein
MSDDAITGTDLVCERLRIRSRKTHLAGVARDVGTGIGKLDAFIAGNATLPTEVMHALVADLYHGSAAWDEQADRLRPAMQEPAKPLGVAPAFAAPGPQFQFGPAQRAPRPEVATPATKPKRSGWLGGWM